jgi:hypothetical protein
MEKISNEQIVSVIEEQTGMSREQFGSVSLNTADRKTYRVIVFNIEKTKKGEPRERKTSNFSFEDALMVFDSISIEIEKNRELKSKITSVKTLITSVQEIKDSGMKVIPIQSNIKEEGTKDDSRSWLN